MTHTDEHVNKLLVIQIGNHYKVFMNSHYDYP